MPSLPLPAAPAGQRRALFSAPLALTCRPWCGRPAGLGSCTKQLYQPKPAPLVFVGASTTQALRLSGRQPTTATAVAPRGRAGTPSEGSFLLAAEKLADRLGAAITAEREEQKQMRMRLYAGSSLRALREEGVVLTDLTAVEEGPLFDSFVWKLFPAPAKGPGSGGSGKQTASSAGGPASTAELPPHKFQRGESVLISWRVRGEPAQQQQQQQQQGSWAESGRTQDGYSSGSRSGSEGEGGAAGQEKDDWPKILSVEGTVLEVRRGYLAVTLSKVAAEVLEEVVDDGNPLRLDKGDPDVTTKRQLQALTRLPNPPPSKGEQRVRVLLVGGPPAVADIPPEWAEERHKGSWYYSAKQMLYATPNLNRSQRDAIEKAISSTFTMWQGPPGTGKTRTLLALIEVLCEANRAVGLPSKGTGTILAAADTNAACDNIVAGLLGAGVKVVRVGNPAKVRPELRSTCLDALVEQTATGKKVVELREKANKKYQEAREAKLRGADRREVHYTRQEADRYWGEAEEQAKTAVANVLASAEVIAGTCTSAGDPRLEHHTFRMVVIDEASQATEPSTLIPILKGSECVVMAGDIKQLPPTVISQQALDYNLDVPLLARLEAGGQGLQPQLLRVQYRMHPAIAEFASKQFYRGQVESGVSAEDRPLIKGVPWKSGCPVVFEHSSSPEARTNTSLKPVGSAAEGRAEGGKSWQNEDEARKALMITRHVLRENSDLTSVAVLTPYNGQVRLLNRLFREAGLLAAPGSSSGGNGSNGSSGSSSSGGPDSAPAQELDLTISTVDGYQGREADVVIFSTVRSNEQGRVGFLSDERRLNVAITRARRALIVLGNGSTLSNDRNWRAWLLWLKEQMSKGGSSSGSSGGSVGTGAGAPPRRPPPRI